MSEFCKKGIKILVVDDDEDDAILVRDFINEGMRRNPYSIEQASSFSEALSRIDTNDYDIFLLDYQLGEGNGLQLMQEIRSKGVPSPVIFLTGHGDEEIAVSAMKAGAADYLPKTKLTSHLLCHSISYSLELYKTNELRRQAENALKESEARYRDLVTHIPAIVCELTPDGVTIFVNPAVTKIIGYLPEELEGKNWWNTFLPREHVPCDNEFYRQFQSGNVTGREIKLISKDGSPRILDWNSTCRYGDDGSVRSIICIGIDITELIQLRDKLQYQSIIDELTGLHNRRGFLTIAPHQMNMANRNKKEMGLVFIDMDGMKWINDTLGHQAGDRALRETADILKETFRGSDMIARMGGDEFAILITETVGISDETIISRLQGHINAHNERENKSCKLSLSVGIVRYDPYQPCTLDELIKKADTSMYKHKQSKKDNRL